MDIKIIEWIKIVIQILGFGATSVGLFLAYRSLKANYNSLRANHDWNRRQYATQIIEKWSSQSLSHRKAIEKEHPGLYDQKRPCDLKVIDSKFAKQIYECKPTDANWEIRFHILELLNFFEYVSVAYINKVADNKMIENSLKNVLLKWYRILYFFIEYVKYNRGYDPWKPYCDLMKVWDASIIEDVPPTDQLD
jgi:hypothetical protein